jgi:hypothetical protein
MKFTEDQLNLAMDEYEKASEFALATHASDVTRIDSLNGLMESFDDFFYEYVYVVIASGFRARVAARVTPRLVACEGNMEKMRKIFRNHRKLDAIAEVWSQKDDWKQLKETLNSVEDLTKLPFIGQITKFHLARNIGLISCAKPDLHLCRWCEKVVGNGDEAVVPAITQAIGDRVGRKQGTVDFMLWVWLSHQGVKQECCNGGYALR